MTNQSRQPKGSETGGQFASSVNPESTVLLDDEPTPLDLTEPVRTTDEAIAWCEGELDKINKEYEEMVSAGHSEDPDALDMRDYMDDLRDQLVDHQRDLIAELRRNFDGFNLDRAIFDNVCATIESRREEDLSDRDVDGVDPQESSRLSDEELERVRVLVEEHLANGITRGSDKALGYMIEEESEYCMENISLDGLEGDEWAKSVIAQASTKNDQTRDYSVWVEPSEGEAPVLIAQVQHHSLES
jgi:hypothetical protein